jgi:DHA2 family multidrug resistance protein
MAPRGAGTLMAALVAPMMVTRFGPTRLMVAGVLMLAAGGYMLSWLTLDASATLIVVSGAVQGAGSCLLWVPMTLVIYRTIPPDLRSQAAGFNTLARYMASAVGITAIQTYTIRLAGESHAQFVDRLQLQNLPSTMNEAIAAGGSSAAQALSAVNAEVTRQATMAAYVDVFAMMSVGMLLMLPMLLLLRQPRPGPG